MHSLSRPLGRRAIVTAGLGAAGTLAAGLVTRKPHAAERVADLAPLSEVLKLINPPVPPAPIVFLAADGTPHRLDEFLGHGMVINLWATWCAPCVAEMPALAALSHALAPQDIAVLPLSSDRGGVKAVLAFFDTHNITGLPILLDPKGAAADAWKADGIPTTVIIDRKGMERARLEGAAEWSTPEAAALVRRLVL
jgi:thiol-disulfide isomerase/thioredoxin